MQIKSTSFCLLIKEVKHKELSIIVPIYLEIDNLNFFCCEIRKIFPLFNKIEVIFVDDQSNDGSVEYIKNLCDSRIKIIERKASSRDLSKSVLLGFANAKYSTLACMDADLSHPISKLQDMYKILTNEKNNLDLVIGSRFMKKSSCNMPLHKLLLSKLAKLIAKFFSDITDPMSGFFMLSKSTLNKAEYFNPIGYKIALEIIVRCNCNNIAEIPINFNLRKYGKSKMSFKISLVYILHVARLIKYKYFNL